MPPAAVARSGPKAAAGVYAPAGAPPLARRVATSVTAALTDALKQRGVADTTAGLLAQVGVATFQTAFARWIDQAGDVGFEECLQQTVAELRSAVAVTPG